MNIALILQMAADTAPERIALVCEGERWSYGELYGAARGAAELFLSHDCQHVALLDESSEAAPIALFGAALAGIPYVPLNYRLADADLGALLDRIAPAYVIGDRERSERLSQGHTCNPRSDFVSGALAKAETASGEEHEGEHRPEGSSHQQHGQPFPFQQIGVGACHVHQGRWPEEQREQHVGEERPEQEIDDDDPGH